MEVIEEDLCYF
jgi:Leucine-rich repeat (LRR) protein